VIPLTTIHSDRNLEKKRYYIRQGVTLTGLSTEKFAKAAEACVSIYEKMSSHFPEDKIGKWENTTYEGHIATTFSARYFTNRHNAPNEASLPFLAGVDPDGVLAGLRRQDLIHGPDNQVTYLRLASNGECVQPKCPTN
jgi:hypothetical protein